MSPLSKAGGTVSNDLPPLRSFGQPDDMGPEPSFVAIRLFINPAGWVAQLTGSDIAQRFPRYESGPAQ